jgi:2-iminobutanoate/2-iminopropanoate deaminase
MNCFPSLEGENMKKEIQPEGLPPAIGPYSPAIQAGKWIYVSGQLPIDPSSGELIQDDMKTAARQALENIKRILVSAEANENDIVKTTVYLRNMSDFPSVNEAYAEFFTPPYPARVCIQITGLPKDARLEIDAVAYKK